MIPMMMILLNNSYIRLSYQTNIMKSIIREYNLIIYIDLLANIFLFKLFHYYLTLKI